MRKLISKSSTNTWITLEEMKNHLRVTGSWDDAILPVYCLAAIQLIEKYCQLNILSTVWEDSYEDSDYQYKIDNHPVTAVNSVKYYDSDNTLQTVSSSDYMVYLPDSSRALVTLKDEVALQTVYCRPDAVIINYTTVITSPPALLKAAVLLQLGSFYENRENETEMNLKVLNIGVQRICDLYNEGKI